jgi:hypothetical protein
MIDTKIEKLQFVRISNDQKLTAYLWCLENLEINEWTGPYDLESLNPPPIFCFAKHSRATLFKLKWA